MVSTFRYAITACVIVACGVDGAQSIATQASSAAVLLRRVAGSDGAWDYAAVDGVGRRLYIARHDGVMAVDLNSYAVTTHFVEGADVHAVVPLRGTGAVLSTNGATDAATVFDGATGKILARISAGHEPDAAVEDPKTGLVLVVNGDDGVVTLIDVAASKSVGTIEVGGKLEFAVTDENGLAYVNVETGGLSCYLKAITNIGYFSCKGQIAVIDINARRVVRRMALTGCDFPTGLAWDSDTDLLISACALNGVAKVIAAKTGAEVATLPIGRFPDAVILDAKRRKLFVPNGGDGTLTIVDIQSASDVRVTGTIKTKSGARTGALDEVTGNVYLPSATLAKQLLPWFHTRYVPGTFEVLVVGWPNSESASLSRATGPLAGATSSTVKIDSVN
jgi:DNA-binding beta-propeller fold protein YncE